MRATHNDDSDEWAFPYAERSVGVRHKVPGAHAKSQQMSTGRTRVRGVTDQRRKSAKRDGLTDGILACPGGVSLALRMTLFSCHSEARSAEESRP